MRSTSPRLLRLNSRHLGRPVHLWCHGWWGTPVLVVPSASGMAHEWELGGAIEALKPWIDGGAIKLYCVETNVSMSLLGHGSLPVRYARHLRWRRFVDEELLAFIDADMQSRGTRMLVAGASFGALLALNLALQKPERFAHALCLSGRFELAPMLSDDGDGSPRWPNHAYRDSVLEEVARTMPTRSAALAGAWFDQPLAYVPGLTGGALKRVRAQTGATLVVGQGPHEGRCLPETIKMARVLQARGIDARLDVWGHDVSHEWVWWRRQLVHHLPQLVQSSRLTHAAG